MLTNKMFSYVFKNESMKVQMSPLWGLTLHKSIFYQDFTPNGVLRNKNFDCVVAAES